MIGKIIGVVITGGIGILFTYLGYLLWKKEKITLLHDYHTEKVSPDNREAFCTLSGIGIVTMGIGLLITAVSLAVTDSVYSFIPFAVCFAAGLVMLTAAGIKYNR